MKKLWYASVLLLMATVAFAAMPQVKTDTDVSHPTVIGTKAAMWDTLSMFTASGTVRCATVGDADNDTDTLETIIGMSASPRDLRQITPLTANTFRSELITNTPANCGVQCVAVGNADSLPGNEIVFGTQQAAASYRSYVGMSKWNGASWTTAYLDSSWLSTVANGQQVHSIKVGDVNGDGINEIVYAMGDTLKMLRYNASTGLFDKSIIFSYGVGTGAHIYGMDIGDFDPDHAGIEIAICTNYGQVAEIYWNGSDWSLSQIVNVSGQYFNVLAVGDFDPDHAGNEIAYGRFNSPTTEIYEAYGGSAGSWTVAKIYTSIAGAQANGIAIGDFDATHAGNELAYAQYGTKQVIELKKIGGLWYDEVTFTGGTEMTDWWGLGGGNANPYHAGDELVACNSAGTTRRALRIQDRAVTTDWAMNLLTNDGAFATRTDMVNIQARMINNSTSANKAVFLNRVNRPDGTIQTNNIDSSATAINPGEFYTYSYSINADTVGKWAVAESMAVTGDSLAANDRKLGKFRTAELFTYPVNEGFETALLPGPNWDTTIVVNAGTTAPAWSRVTSGTNPTTSPHSGTAMAMFNSYNASSGNQARLVLWPAYISSAGYSFSFWMNHYTSGNDSILVDISTNRGLTWTTIAGYPLLGTAGWSQKSISLSPYAGSTVVIALRGRSAYGYNIFIDDIALTSPPAHEVEVKRIVRPAGPAYPVNVPLGVQAMVYNNGMNAESFQTVVSFKDNLGALVFTDSVATSIPALDSALVTLPAYTASAEGLDTIIVNANLPGDELPANNIKAQVVIFSPVFDVPLTEGIENTTFPPAYWSTQTLIGTNVWTREVTGTYPTCSPFRGTAMAKFNSFSANGGQTRLISPFLNIPTGQTYLSFAMYGDPGYATDGDSVHIDVSGDYGVTWTNSIAGFDRRATVAAWRRFVVDLSAYQGSTVLVALRGVSSYGNNIFVDEIHFGQPPYIVSTSPANGATDVALNEPVVIAYSEPMDTLSVMGYSNPDHDFSMAWSATMDTLFLTPDTLYNYNTVYTVYDTAGANQFGLSLTGLPYSWSFTTVANQGPNIEMVLQPGDTYDGTGPFLVRAVITDPAKTSTTLSPRAGVAADTLWYTDNATNWWTITHSAVSGDTFDFSIPGPFAPGTVIEYFLGAWDDQGDATYTPGMYRGYQFKVLDPLAPTALNATAGDMMVQLDWAPPAQVLQYDDGTPNYFWYWTAGDIATTRFTPQHYPCRLEQVVSFWYNNGTGNDSVEVHVWADDGTGLPDMMTDLIPPFKFMPALYPTANVLNLSAYNVVLGSGDFHVGYVCQTTDRPTLLSDAGGPGIRSLFYDHVTATWSNLTYAGGYYDYNHSAVVTYSGYLKGLALKSYLPRKTDKPLPMLAGHKANPITGKQAVQYPELKGALAMAKNISGYSVWRGDVSGGPYLSIGSAGTPTYIDDAVTNGTPYYYVVRAEYNSPDTFSAYSNEATATPAGLPILLVDDDGQVVGSTTWIDGQPYYTAALDGAGYTGQYSVFEKEWGVDGPAAAWYQGRDAVIWFTSYNWNGTLSANDMTNMAAYLDAGGKLFLCGQDIIYDIGLNTFTQNYLGVQAANQDAIANNVNLAGMAGSLAEGYSYALSNTAAIPELYGDDLTAIGGAGYVFDVTAKVGEKPAIQYDNGTFRSVFFAFPFENLVDGANTKAELMYRILNWLNTGVEGNPATEAKPTVFSLASNYPNPVRNSTTIKFGLPKDSDVRIEVFNIAGQRVKTLASGKLGAGYHQITWRGANDNGQKVAAGVYLVRMVTPEFTGTRKMTVIR